MENSDLDQLIDFYEAERNSLKHSIQEAIVDADYLLAQYNAMALEQIEYQLTIFYNLKNSAYSKIEQLNHLKRVYAEEILKEQHEYNRLHYEKKLAEVESKIQYLSQQRGKKQLDTQILDDAIYYLIEDKISYFKLYLQKEYEFYLLFSIEDNELIIAIELNNMIIDNYILEENILLKYANLGFMIDTTCNLLKCRYSILTFKNSIPIKEIITRIIFDIHCFKNFEDSVYIEYP